MYTITAGKIYTINNNYASQFLYIPVIIHKIILLAHLLLLFSLFPSLLLQPTIAKSQSKVKQYDL